MREKIITERIDEMRKDFPQATDQKLRKEVLKQIRTSIKKFKYAPTGNENEPYTNKGIVERRRRIRLKELGAKIEAHKIVPRIKARLEGIRAVKALSSAQPEETSKPVEPIISEAVEASSSGTVKPSKKEDKPDSDADSDETSKTTTEESKNMTAHKNKLASSYYIPKEVTDRIVYSGTNKDKYAVLDEIAKELHSKNRKHKFIEYVSTGKSSITGKHSLKSISLLKTELNIIKKLKLLKSR